MAGEPPGFLRHTAGGVELFVRLTPRASRDAVEGPDRAADGRQHLKVRVRAVPEDGKANRALEKLIASWLDVPARNVRVTAGAKSRLKTVKIDGNAEVLSARLACAQLKPE